MKMFIFSILEHYYVSQDLVSIQLSSPAARHGGFFEPGTSRSALPRTKLSPAAGALLSAEDMPEFQRRHRRRRSPLDGPPSGTSSEQEAHRWSFA